MAHSDSQTPSELFQQGDVLFFKIDALPEKVDNVARRERGLVIAEGEVTGHAHVVEDPKKARLYTLEEILYLVVDEEVDCVHEEHKTVHLTPGVYRIDGVRESDYTAIEERERRERL